MNVKELAIIATAASTLKLCGYPSEATALEKIVTDEEKKVIKH